MLDLTMKNILIADSGGTKCEWCLVSNGKRKKFLTEGLSPYFMSGEQISSIIQNKVIPKLKNQEPEHVFFYGTGLGNPANLVLIRKMLKKQFSTSVINAETDILGAARALSGLEKGNVCILGTGSNCCFYNGKKIAKNFPGLGYVLGDEGSGAYLGKKVIQHYLYDIFDTNLKAAFEATFSHSKQDILDRVYKQEKPNHFIAGFAYFLLQNRGHYLIENIIEDGLNDFFLLHLSRMKESTLYPVHFTGSVSFLFRDKIKEICYNYGMQPGRIIQKPMDGLLSFHTTGQ